LEDEELMRRVLPHRYCTEWSPYNRFLDHQHQTGLEVLEKRETQACQQPAALLSLLVQQGLVQQPALEQQLVASCSGVAAWLQQTMILAHQQNQHCTLMKADPATFGFSAARLPSDC
jgi:hypothetical protein